MPLTDAKIRNARSRAQRYRLSDSHGLSLEISPTGSRFWRYRYRIGGKENIFAAGEWCQAPAGETPEQAQIRQDAGRLTLAEARLARVVWRTQVKAGQHPRLVRMAKRLVAAQSAADTFEAVTRRFIERRGGNWSESYRRHFISLMERDVFPEIGPLPIGALGPAHILGVLEKIEARGVLVMAREARGYIGQVCRFAVASHKATADPTALLRGALSKVETNHHPILKEHDIGPFLRAIAKAQANRQTEIAARLLMFTMLRTVELRCGRWPEIDFRAREWRLDAKRMKMRRPHIVPLSRQAIALLRELHALTGSSEHLFPNARQPKGPMNASTLNRVFERAGYKGVFTPHGFRGTAATLLREAGFHDRLVELQLAHADKNKSRAAYDHAELLGPRREMLQAWADMVEEAERGHRRIR
jgi:integrase